MSWYKTNKNEWKEIIDTISNEIKRNPIMIEKDIIQSMFLHKLSNTSLPFVFKGGTSLSKSYKLINRFSEDIDLSMARKITDSEKKMSKDLIIDISNELGLELKNPDKIFSRRDYNKYVFKYDSLFSSNKLEVIVETSYYQVSYPLEKRKISSFVGEFCGNNNLKLPIQCDALEFTMNVQCIERTFIEKIFAVCDYNIQGKMDRNSRHLYDIAKIYPFIKFDSNFVDLFIRVRLDRMKLKNNPSANISYNIKDILNNIIELGFYEFDYKNITQKLLYENLNYDEAIKQGISKLLNLKFLTLDLKNLKEAKDDIDEISRLMSSYSQKIDSEANKLFFNLQQKHEYCEYLYLCKVTNDSNGTIAFEHLNFKNKIVVLSAIKDAIENYINDKIKNIINEIDFA